MTQYEPHVLLSVLFSMHFLLHTLCFYKIVDFEIEWFFGGIGDIAERSRAILGEGR